jgi:hypothetical protein
VIPCFTSQEPFDLLGFVIGWKLVDYAVTTTATLQDHHKAHLLSRCPPGGHFERKGAMPAKGGCSFLINSFKNRIPDQRTISKNPKVFLMVGFSQSVGNFHIVFIGEWRPCGVTRQLWFFPIAKRYKFGRQ